MGRIHDGDYRIRIPVDMIQLTSRDGKAWPLAFDWEDEGGATVRVEIERVVGNVPFAEQKSGAVGDRYECVINGQSEYLYYTVLAPRKWFKLKQVSREEYERYYKLPGEPVKGK
jgi:hypothetical protein